MSSASTTFVSGGSPTAAQVNGWAQGTLGTATVTANQGTFTAETDLTNLTATVTTVANRRIRISVQVAPSSSVANDTVEFRIKEGATTLVQAWVLVQTGTPMTGTSSVVVTPTAGAHTYKVSMLRGAGTGNITNNASGTAPSLFLVEDIGAV